MYTWWLTAAGIAGVVTLLGLAKPPAPVGTEKWVLALAGISLIVTIAGVV
jgi:hypothetical protein